MFYYLFIKKRILVSPKFFLIINIFNLILGHDKGGINGGL